MLVVGEASCRSVLLMRYRGPHEPDAQREQQTLAAGEASYRSVLLQKHRISASHGNPVLTESSMRSQQVKAVADAYRRLRSAGQTDPVLRESSMRSRRLNEVAEAYHRLLFADYMDPVEAYRHLRSAGHMASVLRESIKRSRCWQQHTLTADEASCWSVSMYTFYGPHAPSECSERAARAGSG